MYQQKEERDYDDQLNAGHNNNLTKGAGFGESSFAFDQMIRKKQPEIKIMNEYSEDKD